ncbi:hypothetical protein [Nonomuraea sp. NPDC003804]|uniref:hypothetical protein n=1 Tax=Nonomuraea sp. NPDC003804 TaxID=3154547 RepID=UPI0033A63DA7
MIRDTCGLQIPGCGGERGQVGVQEADLPLGREFLRVEQCLHDEAEREGLDRRRDLENSFKRPTVARLCVAWAWDLPVPARAPPSSGGGAFAL